MMKEICRWEHSVDMTNFLLRRGVLICGMALPAMLADQVSALQVPNDRLTPESCAREVSASTGMPYMVMSKGALEFGISSRPEPFHKVPLAIWVSNPTDKEAAVLTCSDLEFFFYREMSVFDQDGHRVPSKQEIKDHAEPAPLRDQWKCLRNILRRIPPHGCIHGDLDKPDHDFVKELTDLYVLKPGSYTITARPGASEQKKLPVGLAIQVLP